MAATDNSFLSLLVLQSTAAGDFPISELHQILEQLPFSIDPTKVAWRPLPDTPAGLTYWGAAIAPESMGPLDPIHPNNSTIVLHGSNGKSITACHLREAGISRLLGGMFQFAELASTLFQAIPLSEEEVRNIQREATNIAAGVTAEHINDTIRIQSFVDTAMAVAPEAIDNFLGLLDKYVFANYSGEQIEHVRALLGGEESFVRSKLKLFKAAATIWNTVDNSHIVISNLLEVGNQVDLVIKQNCKALHLGLSQVMRKNDYLIEQWKAFQTAPSEDTNTAYGHLEVITLLTVETCQLAINLHNQIVKVMDQVNHLTKTIEGYREKAKYRMILTGGTLLMRFVPHVLKIVVSPLESGWECALYILTCGHNAIDTFQQTLTLTEMSLQIAGFFTFRSAHHTCIEFLTTLQRELEPVIREYIAQLREHTQAIQQSSLQSLKIQAPMRIDELTHQKGLLQENLDHLSGFAAKHSIPLPSSPTKQ